MGIIGWNPSGAVRLVSAGQQVRSIAPGQEFSSPTAGVGAFAFGDGNARFAPVFVGSTINIDRLSVNVTAVGTAGSVTRLVLCDDNGFKPGAVVAQGTVDSTTTGFKSLAVSVTLRPGVYWATAINQGAPVTPPTLSFINAMGLALAFDSQPTASSFAWAATIAGVAANNPAVTATFSPPRVFLRQGP